MKLVIATPLYPPEIGGPATYAKRFVEGLPQRGITVVLVSFSAVRRLPSGIRHGVYFWRIFSALRRADAVLALDTWSVGVPACFAAWLLRKKLFIRIGGDFLWEKYIDRAPKPMKLSEFYEHMPPLTFKERIIFIGTRWLVKNANVLLFNTAWQRDIWAKAYEFDTARARILENAYPAERTVTPADGKTFVSAGRPRRLKNSSALATVFAELQTRHPDIALDTRLLPPDEHRDRIQKAYAIVIPSVSEMGPNTAIDAMQYGKPFIAPIDSGTRDRLSEVGIFVDTLDTSALMNAIESLLDPVEYERACKRVQAFSFEHSWDQLLDELTDILS